MPSINDLLENIRILSEYIIAQKRKKKMQKEDIKNKKKGNKIPDGWRKVKLGEVMRTARVDYEKVKTSEYKIAGRLPIFDQGSDDIAGYTDNPKAEYRGKFPVILFGDHTLKLKIAELPFAIGADGIQILEPDEKLFDRKFFYYAIKGLKVRSYGYERHMKYLRELDITCPNLVDQKRIADILSAFDDKIELNNKINKNLEEMAQTIFKEWFVNFKFPGHEKVKFVDSELGKIPEGWRVEKLDNLVKEISRGPSLRYVSENGIPVLNQRCVRNGEIELDSIQYASSVNNKFYLQKRDILINSMGTGTLGRVSRNLNINHPMIIHNCITFIRAEENKIPQILLYYQVKKKEKNFELLGEGSTGQSSLKLNLIKNLSILVPEKKTRTYFAETVNSFWEIVGNIKKENQKLSVLRDLLLPKLMSGEIRV